MRLVQIALPPGKEEAITAALEDQDIEFVVIDLKSQDRYEVEITFALPTHAVEEVLDTLRQAGLSDAAQTVILDAETVMGKRYERVEESFEETEKSEDHISRQELSTRAVELTPTMPIYVAMTLISAVVATAGLLLNSPAVVVGSMVIAPLIGPALSASVGTVINDDDLFHSGFVYQVIGVVVAILGAAVFAGLLRFSMLVPPGEEVFAIAEVAERLEPDLLSLFIALGAGVAGIISLITGIAPALVGVMIAAALIPPAAAAGVAFAWGEPVLAIGATVLVLVNLVSINISGLVTLWYSGYRPERFFETDEARRQLLTQLGLYGIAAGILSSFLLASSITAVRQARFEETVEETVESVVAEREENEMTPLEYEFIYSDRPVLPEPEQITIDIGSASGDPIAGLATEIAEAIEERTGYSLRISLRYVAIETTGNG